MTKSTKLVAIRDGHGSSTPGKRTPVMPDGKVMKENEFNKAVANLLEVELKRCGFKTLQVAPTDEDTSLEKGVKTANDAKADLFLSIHANALDGKFDGAKDPKGIETFAWKTGESPRIAKVIHKEVIKATGLQDRGVKDGSWLYEAKNTKMPYVLFELGFMDNLNEAGLLRSNTYRETCAVAIAKGVCQVFGVKYASKPVAQATKFKPVVKTVASTNTSTYTVKSGDSLWEIATTYKTTVANLQAWNGLKTSTIHVGDKLIVSKSTVHVVKSGDTLWEVSQKYNISVSSLKTKNGLKTDVIHVGDRLTVT